MFKKHKTIHSDIKILLLNSFFSPHRGNGDEFNNSDQSTVLRDECTEKDEKKQNTPHRKPSKNS